MLPTDIDKANLAVLLAQSETHPLVAQVPASRRPWLLPVRWDTQRLWQIAHPTVTLAIADLRWLYDLPWWRGLDGRPFAVSPAEFMNDPSRFPEHVARVQDADLSHAIHAIRRHGRSIILDGVHRLVRADLAGARTVEVVYLSAADLVTIAVPALPGATRHAPCAPGDGW